ncbi:hypothetical protein IWQ47_002198 [Aquimarina sp. EL_43]|uniref:hypothetical protein n=1 Tax=unclassified Aquimarina TaxID=2627091 RepID=UPI0018C93892|nr:MULTISPECIES: hypothetical protein [unclassified Aquimarina]MBG6130734.1 hypothetical protein [Aquimarina sp. EL_35]MBG6151119.1 hypothetical protein [Aquimarina sp. EL_32]MBG6169124.1 hypothetical protein [Aquimarina sp. EL_43]
MKYIKITILVVLFFSCNKEKEYNSDNVLVVGNWYDLKKESYQEYYFDDKSMYTYDPYSGNVSEYHYITRNDSIFRYFVHPELSSEYKFYDRIIEQGSLQIKLENTTLIKVKEDSNTLEMFINNKIDEKKYYTSCMDREKNTIPPDSKTSFKINLDDI